MKEQFVRTALLIGNDGVEKLGNCRVCVFGAGGVGGFVIEALARAGVGAIDIVDDDTVSASNINRQIIATWDTVGRHKTEVAAERVLSINPDCKVVQHKCFYLPQTRDEFDFNQYDYVVDAIDTVTAKLDLAQNAYATHTPIISSMGMGNKLDPTKIEVADINETSFCKLAKVMRKELRKRGVPKLKCVYSKEQTVAQVEELNEKPGAHPKRSTPGSISFMPSVAGLIIAGEVVRDLLEKNADDDE